MKFLKFTKLFLIQLFLSSQILFTSVSFAVSADEAIELAETLVEETEARFILGELTTIETSQAKVHLEETKLLFGNIRVSDFCTVALPLQETVVEGLMQRSGLGLSQTTNVIVEQKKLFEMQFQCEGAI